MSTQDEYTKNRQKKALESWEKPLSMPVAVPKPGGGKKKRGKGKGSDEQESS